MTYTNKSDINILKELQSKSFILSNVYEYTIFQQYIQRALPIGTEYSFRLIHKTQLNKAGLY